MHLIKKERTAGSQAFWFEALVNVIPHCSATLFSAVWASNKGKVPTGEGSFIWEDEERTIIGLWPRSTHLSTNYEEFVGKKGISSISIFPSYIPFLISMSVTGGTKENALDMSVAPVSMCPGDIRGAEWDPRLLTCGRVERKKWFSPLA